MTTQTPAEPVLQPAVKRDLVVPLDSVEWRDSGNPEAKNETTLRGHAAVFNSLSEDLGGFREIIEPGAFRAILRKQPDVRLLFNHDPNYVMARTASDSLELREDGSGLHVFARVDRSISWVNDLRASMQRGDIDQMSFAFTIREGGDDWAVTEDGQIVRTIRADGVDGLYDASVVTYPAYRKTDVNMRSVLDQAISTGRLPDLAGATEVIAADTPGDESASRSNAGVDNGTRRRLEALRAHSRRRLVLIHPIHKD